MRSWSPRSCARHDSHPGGRADAIAGKHSARASRKTLRKPTRQQWRVRSYLNAQTCSLRSDLVAASPLAQEISATRSYLDPRPLESVSTGQPFPLLQRSAKKPPDDYARKRLGLLLCHGHGARKRCSPRKAPNRRQPDRSRGVPGAANTRA